MKAEIKPIADLNRVRLADVVPLDTPFALYLFHTNVCNFKCSYCAHSLGKEGMLKEYGFKPEVMQMEVFERTLEQMKAFPQKFKFVSFTGQGEPLTNKRLPELVARMKAAGVAEMTEVITNGALLTHDMSSALIDAGLDRIKISIQGVTSKAYQELTGVKVDFDKFVEQVRFLFERKGDMQLFVKVMDISLEPGEDEKFYQIFGEITDRMYIETCRPVYPGVEYENNPDESTMDRFGRPHEKRMVCPLCFFHLAIWPNGDVVPCDTILKPLVLGNVRSGLLKDMWNGPAHREFCSMQLRKERSSCNSQCARCIAPDDVCHPEDALDEAAERILAAHYQ
ncbi:radical SAM protein [Geobacter sulfurreducens]|uniref:radical SAM protein n=1 Tax=Geobacter sulfurreducens TaxID=35554 RepID=UPI0020B8B9F1|nr:radical SAM protein [Geobacter sulfurreducens]UTG92340.1 radical SAM protein [Geobacter sulfurreducens]